jgi:glucose/arabinose dehydrogenase
MIGSGLDGATRPEVIMTAYRKFLMSVLPLLALSVAGAADQPQATTPPTDMPGLPPLTPIAENLVKPVGITHAGDGSGRLFITLQDGEIVIWDGNEVLPTPFLDIDSIVNSGGSEQGLLGLAFHPDYEANGFFYVNYTDNTGADTVVARYSVSAADPNVANPNSAVMLMEIDQPFSNHNGGQLQFGPDGYLYIAMGDGGSAGDPGDRAQDLTERLGKMLRVDVNGGGSPPDCGSGVNYTVPADNPFVDGPGGNCDEIWHLGLRNPWRFSFDRLTGDMFIGDVGQNAWEEVNFQPAASAGGENWGWRCYEGNHPFNTAGCGPAGDYDFPILEYPHSLGCSITGGYAYRGPAMPGLGQGTYLFADFCSGRVWGTRLQGGQWRRVQFGDTPYMISSFGETEAGELCFTHDDTSRQPTGIVFCMLP